jgi:LysM repeat protein
VNSLKNVLVITVLLGVGYAVYITINSQPGPSRPAEQTDGWPAPVDVQVPGEGDSKSGATRNPFAPGGNQAAERVPARDGGPFGPSRNGPNGAARTLSQSGPTDRGMSMFPPRDVKPVAPPADSAQRSAGGLRPGGNPSAEVPGVAMSTDLPSYPPSDPPAGTTPTRKSDGPSPGPSGVRSDFVAMMDEAQRRLAKGELAEVHLALSRFYADPDLRADLTAEESHQLTELLDQLAGTVIYSRQHLLEPPYVVKPGDSLQQIAQSYNVPAQVLAKINGIREPDRLQPGRQLKVFRGPFEAVVSLQRYELVLMLGGRYAGRFPIGVGRDSPQLTGSYTVKRKLTNPTNSGPNRNVGPGDPNIPPGKCWLDLGDRIGIQETEDVKNLGRAGGRGGICLGPRDIEDLYDILTADSESSVGSRVTIRR